MTRLRKAEIALCIAVIAVILWFGWLGVAQGLAGEPTGAIAAIGGLYWFGVLLREQKKSEKLGNLLLDTEINAAMHEARTQTEITANSAEIRHKIDVGYYQGR